MHTSPVAVALSSVVLAPPVTFRNLAMFPLLRPNAPQQPADAYMVLDDALASGIVEITEVSEQGSVPELRVVNRGTEPTLIIDGEELVGAKQNRIVNLTILVPAGAQLTIPVSCVEAGRWRSRSRGFSSAPRAQYATGRAKRMSQVTHSMTTRNARTSDQSAVWADIADVSMRLKTSSPTGAMEAIFVDHSPFIDDCVASCRPVEGQTGALFAVGGRVIGFDLFDSPAVLGKLLPKLVRGVAVDALDAQWAAREGFPKATTDRTSPRLFLDAVRDGAWRESPAVGLGRDLRLHGDGLTGAALTLNVRTVHVSAFSL